MAGAKIIEMKITTKSPVIIVHRVKKNIYETISGILPGSTIRGAIFMAIIRELARERGKSIDEFLRNVEKEHDAISGELKNPTARFSPAIPIINGKPAMVAHILMYKRKIPKNNENSIFSRLKSTKDVLKFLSAESYEELLEFIPSVAEGYPKSIGGALIIIKNGEINLVNVSEQLLWRHESIGIDRLRGTTEEGLLYGYDVIGINVSFYATIFDPHEIISSNLEKIAPKKKLDIYVGRGRSRGFGYCEVEFEIHDAEKFIKEKAKDRYVCYDNKVIAIAVSPIVDIVGDRSVTFVRKAHVKLNDIEVKLELENIENKPFVLCSKTEFIGWGYRIPHRDNGIVYGGPKLRLTCAGIGSIFVYKCNTNTDISYALKLIEITGLNNLSIIGLNFVRFLTKEYLVE